MKNTKLWSGLLAVALAVFLTLPAARAATQTVDGVTWTFQYVVPTYPTYDPNVVKASLGGGSASTPAIPTSTTGAISIPSTLGGRPVSIGSYAFYGCSGLTSVTIPDDVTDISHYAFQNCKGLTNVTIGNRVAYIWSSAFYGCSGLTSVAIPDSVTDIGSYVFYSCRGLTNVTIGNNVADIGESAFYGCSGLTSVAIPDGVTHIGSYAFSRCNGLTNVTIGKGVRRIDYGAFADCGKLASVTIPENVVDLGSGVFTGCANSMFDKTSVPGICLVDGWVVGTTKPFPAELDLAGIRGIAGRTFYDFTNLTHVTIPNSMASIGSEAFRNCSGLASVEIPDSVTSIGYGAFAGCSGLAYVTIPNSVTSIGQIAFLNCSALENLTIPDSVTDIGYCAFQNCNNLGNLAILGNVTNDWSYYDDGSPFLNCTNLKTVVLSGKMATIGACMFSGCHTLTNVTIGSSVAKIEERAFENCTGLASLAIPDSVTSIGWKAFVGAGLGSVTLGDGLSNSWAGAFWGCSNLTNVTISSRLTSIPIGAFYDCSGLTGITIPDNVTNIGGSAFCGCSGLADLTIPDNVTSIGDSSFCGCSGLASLTIPDSVTSIGGYAFQNCTGLTDVTIGSGVTNLGNSVFSGCTALTTLFVPAEWEGTAKLANAGVPAGCKVVYAMPVELDGEGNGTISKDGTEWTFRVEGGKAVLTAVRSGNAWLEVLAQVYVKDFGKMPVARIANGAFAGCGNLTAVVLPESIETIAKDAFAGCAGLRAVLAPWEWEGSGRMDGVTVPSGCSVSCSVHSGALAASQSWKAGTVHVVVGKLTVGNGVTVTIEPETIVKFTDESRLAVLSGGSCIACGVVFTHVADDTAGGDTMGDGETTKPAMGRYVISGTVEDDDATEYRYLPPHVLSSSISSDTHLKGYRTYIASNSVTVASGATLTLQPGTILKFATGCQFTVNGTLDAKGSRAAPIVFTSLKDDEHGGDGNGDGDATAPQPGDWYQIKVAGKADFDHCSVLYASSTENYGGVEAYGGTVTFDNGEIAHMKYDSVNAHSSGTFTAHNTTIWDGSLGLGYYGSGRVKLYNCVFQGLTTAVRQSGKLLVNCILSDCKSFTDQDGDGSTFDHCVFFNPVNFGAQNYSKVGRNGNVWGDPLFADPDNGDFRLLSATSPCVDAADTTQAPETDFYGQERLTIRYAPAGTPDALGRHADIGIQEFLPEDEAGAYDLAAKAVSTEAANVVLGQKISVSWSVANAGKRAAPDTWHDALALVSVATGKAYPLGEPINSGGLDAWAERAFTDSFTVPVLPEGTYRLRLTVNSRRSEVPEGASTGNNAVLSDGTVAIAVPAAAASAGSNGKVAAGASAAVAFSVPAESGDLLLRVSAPAGGNALSGRVGLGHLPADAASGTALVFADGEAWLMVPAGTETVWLVLDNGGTAEAAYTADFRAGSLSLASVASATLPASGKVTLHITGAGFTDACRVLVGGVSASAVRCVNESLLSATVDCAKLAAGSKPAVTVTKGAETKTLANAITVSFSAGAGKFWAKLSVPESVREGRLVQTCFVEYGNSGTADVLAPILQVMMEGNGTLGYIGGLQGQKTLQFVAAGDAGSAGILRPGETHRIRFALRAGASNKISLHSSIGSAYVPAPWANAADYLADLSASATRIGLRGQDATDYALVLELAKAVKNGEATSAICGKVFDQQGEGLGGVALTFVDSNACVSAMTQTSPNGDFIVFPLKVGMYQLELDGIVPLGELPEIAVNGVDDIVGLHLPVSASPRCVATISNATGDGPLQIFVRRLDGPEVYSPIWESEKVAAFKGLPDGWYRMDANQDDKVAVASFVVYDGESLEVPLELRASGRMEGTIPGFTTPEEMGVMILSREGLFWFAEANDDGTWQSPLLPPGTYSVYPLGSDSDKCPAVEDVEIGEGVVARIDFASGSFRRGTKSAPLRQPKTAAAGESLWPWSYWGIRDDLDSAIEKGLGLLSTTYIAKPWVACAHNEAKFIRDSNAYDAFVANHRKLCAFKERLPDGYFAPIAWNFGKASIHLGAAVARVAAIEAMAAPQITALVDEIAGLAETLGDDAISVIFEGREYSLLDATESLFVPRLDNAIAALVDNFSTPACLQDIVASGNLKPFIRKLDNALLAYDEAMKFKRILEATLRERGIVAPVALNGVFYGLNIAMTELKSLSYLLKGIQAWDDGYENWMNDSRRIAKALAWWKQVYADFVTVSLQFNQYHAPCPDEEIGEISAAPVESRMPTVPQSCDPNEMRGPEGTEADRLVEAGEGYDYTIYFENKTNATAAAAEVRVTERLSPQLDWTSFQMVEVSFGETTDIGLAGKANGTSETNLAGTNWTVRTEVALDATNGVVTWYLRVVDPEGDEDGWPLDPTAGFLPPNDETHRGEGHITYRVKVKGNATENTRIDASATIVFDNNDPIATDPAWWNTVAWRSYGVKFNANGGKGSMAEQRIQRDVATKLSANKFTRSGHTFIGWSKSKAGGVAYGNAANVKNLAAAGGSVTLYAQWAKNKYSVKYNANGGALPKGKTMAAQALTYGKAAKLRKNAFTRKDCVFIGWATSKSGKVAYKNAQAVKNLRTDGKTTTLYAKWAKKTYTVAFNANGGKGTMAKQKMVYGKAAKLRKNAFTKKDSVFLGWATGKNGKVVYKNAQAVKNLRTDGKTTTLHAQWAKKTYKVAFLANGGTGKMAVQPLTWGKAARLSANQFARKGWTFAGWSRTAGGAKAYGDKQSVKNLVADGSTVKLYALWKANGGAKGVQADGGDGEGTDSVPTMAADEPWVVVTTSDKSDGLAVADGDEGTAWSPETADGSWVVLSFADAVDVSDVEVAGENLPEGTRILISEDADDWQEEVPGAARYVWVLFPASEEPPVVREIRVEE